MRRIPSVIAASVALMVLAFAGGCARYTTVLGSSITNGAEMSHSITHDRLSAAVLPTVDWSLTDPGRGERADAYDDVEVLVTNELTRALWRKNSLHVTKRGVVLGALATAELSKRDLFGPPATAKCGTWTCPQVLLSEPSSEHGPNLAKLYDCGDGMAVDLLLVSRVTRNVREGQNRDLIIDIMFLDVRNRTIAGYGYFGGRAAKDDTVGVENAASAVLYYTPMPDSAFLARSASSERGRGMANLLLRDIGGLNVDVSGAMDFADETWRMYPAGYFDRNHRITVADHRRVVR